MNISIRVPYEEKRTRRALKFLVGGNVRALRVAGVLLVLSGIALLVVLDGGPLTSGAVILGGFFLAVLFEPYVVWQTMRNQASILRQDYLLTLDDAGIAVKNEAFDARYAWSALDRVVEKPDAWYLMFGKHQGQVVFKELLTEEQRAVLTAFLAHRSPAPQPAA